MCVLSLSVTLLLVSFSYYLLMCSKILLIFLLFILLFSGVYLSVQTRPLECLETLSFLLSPVHCVPSWYFELKELVMTGLG